LAETGDFVFRTGDAGDVGAGLLDDPLLTARRASTPAQILGMLLHLLFPVHAAQSLDAMGFEYEVNRLHERRFIGDLSPAPTSGRRQGSQGGLGMAQTFVQARRLVVGMQGDRTTMTRSVQPAWLPFTQQVRSNSYPSAASTS
jgi:hypothetical protein